MTGLILFAHGARDPRWREAFDRLQEVVACRHDGPLRLAFLESMAPDLITAALSVKAAGARRIVVVPLFLGSGGHLRRDLPSMLDQARQATQLEITSVTAAGEDDTVLEALARYCVSAAGAQHGG